MEEAFRPTTRTYYVYVCVCVVYFTRMVNARLTVYDNATGSGKRRVWYLDAEEHHKINSSNLPFFINSVGVARNSN